jgi:hypothetical protein
MKLTTTSSATPIPCLLGIRVVDKYESDREKDESKMNLKNLQSKFNQLNQASGAKFLLADLDLRYGECILLYPLNSSTVVLTGEGWFNLWSKSLWQDLQRR